MKQAYKYRAKWIQGIKNSHILLSESQVANSECVRHLLSWLRLNCVAGSGFPWWDRRHAAVAERHRTSAVGIKGCGRLTRHGPGAAYRPSGMCLTIWEAAYRWQTWEEVTLSFLCFIWSVKIKRRYKIHYSHCPAVCDKKELFKCF